MITIVFYFKNRLQNQFTAAIGMDDCEASLWPHWPVHASVMYASFWFYYSVDRWISVFGWEVGKNYGNDEWEMIDRETIQSIAAQVPNNTEHIDTPMSTRSKSFLNVEENEPETNQIQEIEKENVTLELVGDDASTNPAFDAGEPTIDTREV